MFCLCILKFLANAKVIDCMKVWFIHKVHLLVYSLKKELVIQFTVSCNQVANENLTREIRAIVIKRKIICFLKATVFLIFPYSKLPIQTPALNGMSNPKDRFSI